MGHVSLGRTILKSVLSLTIAAQGPMAFAAAGPQTNAVVNMNDVATQLKRMSRSKSSFCFAVENGAVSGFNENEPMRAASVTKTLTTFWAVEKLGPDFQYTTHIFYQPSTHEMHIQGQRDPFFDRDRLYTLLADMNRKGVTTLNRLTVDSNFWFWPDATEFRYMQGGGSGIGGHRHGNSHSKTKKSAASHHSSKSRHAMNESMPTDGRSPASYSFSNLNFKHFVEVESHTDQTLAGEPGRIAKYLDISFNTDSWGSAMKQRFQAARSMNPELSLPATVKMKTDSIDIVLPENNPLKGKPGVFEFVVKSAPMRHYLKIMNIWSINPYAEEIFFSLGGKAAFESFMQKKIGYGSRVSNVNTGSGVNMHGASRNDSMVSCSTVVSIIRRLDQDMEKRGLDLSDILAVPGNDGGTWQDASKTLVAKTGTLNHPTASKNLAGVDETTKGEVYFGIFIDRGGDKYKVQKVLTAMRSSLKKSNFTGVQVKETPYSFHPSGSFNHMQQVGPKDDVVPVVNLVLK